MFTASKSCHGSQIRLAVVITAVLASTLDIIPASLKTDFIRLLPYILGNLYGDTSAAF